MRRRGAWLLLGGVSLGVAVAQPAAETPNPPAERGWLVEGVRAREAEAEARREAATPPRPQSPASPRPDLPRLPAAADPATEPLWERMMQRWTVPRGRESAAAATRGPNPFLPPASPEPARSLTPLPAATPPVSAMPPAGEVVAEAPPPPRLAEPEAEASAPRREPHRPAPPERERERYFRQLPNKF